MVYVVERYLPGLSRSALLSGLSRLEPVIEDLGKERPAVRYLGSTIVIEDEACFCQFEGSSVAAVAEANRRADLPFDRIVPAVLVQPTYRSSEMSISTSIPKTVGRRRSHTPPAIAAILAVIALASWTVATLVVHPATRSVRSIAPTQASVLRSLTPEGREYVLGIMSMTPGELSAAFNTSQPSVAGQDIGSSAHKTRSGAPSLASVLRSLTPSERRYVLGIASLSPLQLWAAFGTSPTPPASRASGSAVASIATGSATLPILPACGPGPCWRAATNPPRPVRRAR